MLVTAVLLIPDAAVSVPQSVADGVVAPKALVADPQVLSAMMLLRSVTDVKVIAFEPGAFITPTTLSWMWLFATSTRIWAEDGCTLIPAWKPQTSESTM